MLDVGKYDLIDWDDPESDPDPATNNLLHCQQADHLGAQAELVVYELLAGVWAEVNFKTMTAQWAIVGLALSRVWLVLLKESEKRGDWLRPVTGWPAETAEIRQWEKLTGQKWRGR